jgi:lysophospholipase L1-like esterase
MKQLTVKKTRLLGLLILVIAIPLVIGPLMLTQQGLKQKAQALEGIISRHLISQQPGRVSSSPIISRGVPAFASSGYSPASNANDDSYDTTWRSQGTPAWLAYDLSTVPASIRSKVLVVWYNETNNYDHTVISYPAYNIPQDYTIEVNQASGGGNPPDTGWVALVPVKGNHYHSREHVVDMTGINWIRIHVTAVDGSPENYDVSINMDIYTASYGLADDWIFFGDSITAGGMGHWTAGGVKTFAQLINAQAPGHFPAQESGGIGFLTSADGAKYINTWLLLFPGKYVGVSYGTNDANGCVNPDTYYDNYITTVRAVLLAGKVPVVPHIPWARTANVQNCGPDLNAKINALYKAFPQIIKGPDFWTFFQNHQDLVSNDNIHPTETGFGAYRQQWANAMLKAVYIVEK